ncbi:nucleoside hydrolase [Lignipirellula cremea]|uniref:Pyrimidine-specific ribonucleoside hydrolase RihA n=1 Tax=Lignipirellula cremea TaxID=2528010 RepID=A0A518DN95_9BACT|nr:nucleoside hydrolase [Lignipirellula cremea]QDU93309.1 Pyrimidine-specific ribonucleoside hydrolase RihA [Lignipirellula cremea]
MPRKVIIDCDPGIDDALALCLALFDPRLEVTAITAVAGNVSAEQSSRNVQKIIDQLDPPRLPRIGTAQPCEAAPPVDRRHLFGGDGLGNCNMPVSELHHQHVSDKLIFDEIRSAPERVTIIALGPLTNIARAFQRDPSLISMVDRIIISGGSVAKGGNATAAAEFNMFYDPESAAAVFRSATTKTLVPLDVTNRVKIGMNLLNELPDEETQVGGFLHRMLPFAFRSYHQILGQESILLHDCVALLAAVQPELFETIEMAGDVETMGNLTTGATVFDRRTQAEWRTNMEVAVDVDVAGAADCIVRGLKNAGS